MSGYESNIKSSELGQEAPDSPPKHLQLANAIAELDGLSGHIDNLIQAIEGPKPTAGNDPNDRTVEPSLLEILDAGPRLIRERVEIMHARLVEVERLLFGG